MRTGDHAPDFTLRDHRGLPFHLGDALVDGPVVLFFYPAAGSAGCTAESCHFRDLAAPFADAGAQRVGVSMDGVERQASFADANALDYPLLADVGGHVAAAYGVKRPLDLLRVRRTTFVIDVDRRILEKITGEFSMNAHADRALAVLAARA